VKFKIDENLPVEAALTLREHGFDADTVSDEALSGVDDETMANRVPAENRILVTLDLDFSNIRAYPPDEYAGIIVLRLKTQDKPTVLSYIRRFAAAVEKRSPEGELWIVQNDRIRFRQGSQSP
jgi:predicted nuclease of predicted toxin-antitoxin system